MKHLITALVLASLAACANTTQQPLSINSPRLDSGIRGNGGGGLGGETTVGRSTGGAGTVSRVTVP